MKNEETQQQPIEAISQIKTRSKTKPPPKLFMKFQTWEKQSHGLFDYQCDVHKISNEEYLVENSSRVFRSSNTRKTTIKDISEETKNIPQRTEIFTVQYDAKKRAYILKNSLSTHLQQVMTSQKQQSDILVQKGKLFHAMNEKGPGQKLEIGDFIKLGRVELVVLQINNTKKTESIDFQQIYGTKQFIFHLKENLSGNCKICLSDQIQQGDPLINPCNCKGSCGVIHLGCLKSWINNKVKRQIFGKVRTYNFQKFDCQICKAPFPSLIKLQNNTQIQLLNFQRPTSPYILLQQLSQTQQKNAKILHFVLPQQGRRVIIGRGHTCELNISDISVSRFHSAITFTKNNFVIHDLKSKFGTLLQVKQEILIDNNLNLQYNGCSMNFELVEQKKQRNSRSGKKLP